MGPQSDLLKPTPFSRLGWALWCLWLLVGTLTLAFMDKGEGVLALNGQHSPLLDRLFWLLTGLGNGWMFLLALILLVLIRNYHTLPFLFAVLLQTALVHLGKRILFPGALRPRAWFDESIPLHVVEGVKTHMVHSFPSGHTATAFTLACLVMLLHQRTWSTLLAFGLAIGAGLSRMYLIQHFAEDVVVGSIVGLITVLITWALFYRSIPKALQGPFWHRSILSRSAQQG